MVAETRSRHSRGGAPLFSQLHRSSTPVPLLSGVVGGAIELAGVKLGSNMDSCRVFVWPATHLSGFRDLERERHARPR